MLSVQNVNFCQDRFLFNKQKKNNEIPVPLSDKQLIEHSLYNIPFKGIFSTRNKKEKSLLLPERVQIIRMFGYNQSDAWAHDLLNLTYETSKDVKNNLGFNFLTKKLRFNLLGIKRKYNIVSSGTINGLTEVNKYAKGREYLQKYFERYDAKKDNNGSYSPKSNSEYPDANVCKIRNYSPNSLLVTNGSIYDHGVSNLALAKKEYEKLKSADNPKLEDITHSIATIHWLIAQETPYKDLNGLTADILSRAIYHAYNVKTYPLKENTSLEFEAYYSDLDDYIKNYPNYFEKPPEMQ